MDKEKMNLRPRPLFILLLIIIEVFVVLVNPFRLISALIILGINIFCIQYGLKMKRWLTLQNREKIQKASTVAESNLSYVSEIMPVGIISYQPTTQKIEWLNPFALGIKDKSALSEEDFLDAFFIAKEKKKNQLYLADKTFQFELDTVKGVVYFSDVTQNQLLKLHQVNSQPVIGILSIDNYTEAVDKLDDKEVSYLNSFITTLISDWMNEYHVFFKRINSERFFFFAQMIDLKKMMDKKFDLLDRLRAEAEKQNHPLTISMGIAYGSHSLDEIGSEAQNNLDIALVRGGDQVVVKEMREGAKPAYYGGKSATTIKRTRVRSRAMSTALRKIFDETGDVFIMGHRFPDMDAIGSAIGVSCLARFNQKKAFIVIDENEIIPDVERCLEEIHKHPDIESQLITPERAIELKKENDLLVMVDYHKPSLSISQGVYEQFDKIVIIDHHRRGEEFPSKPLLTYIESSASSASELVTELIQYQSSRTNRISRFEATLLLSGMTVDTNNFNVRTTARTFDVASYLKTCSADASLVQYLLSSDLATYLDISHLISQSEYVTDDIVVAAGTDEKAYNSVIAAKTADTLLSMVNINGAFVITKRTDGLVGISARSSGTINVQLIMESLGGGGHFTNAATQMEDISVEEAKQQLLVAIKENMKELYDKE
ncbi:DHH family protein [Enterococcus sp. 10A9_DIV0425]|uniref:Cyclic-di-AMP phosphodiesterase n=1 Tax=Candidatus Enterococcus wittei TaxID=1987383 RepID=A0A242JZL8_9ENTE|nr:DHH family phosphoesterase [Enterococcus sp. 10A9_DIV0425]OTP10775.1 DHH family protein [Enterococcus sp. 10A9_DIV0425]THE11676.1 phosphoesterase [Enterococcus hirae]